MDHGHQLMFLNALSRKKQLAFALLILERMVPDLIAFSKEVGFDVSCHLNAKNAAWRVLEDDDPINPSLRDTCLGQVPDTEAFSHELTSQALNAALTAVSILEFVQDGRADHLAYISTLATDSIDLYLNGLGDRILDDPDDWTVMTNPLMQSELHRQESDIIFLSTLSDKFDHRTLAVLRARAKSQPQLLPTSRQ
jgi:hypothetical protein